MQYRKFAFVAVVLLLVLAAAVPAFAQGNSPVAPLVGQDSPNAIQGHYIVVFKDRAPEGAVEHAMSGLRDVQVDYVYTDAIRGFAAALPDQAVEGLRHNPNIDYIEVDSTVSLDTTQSGATWGLDRIDQASLPLSGTYDYTNTGAGVKAYIIDTGIRTTHSEFGGRASYGYDAVGGKGSGTDCNGHGTHVSGTVGGKTYGVAKGVSLVAVRVLNCRGSGTTAGVVAGIDWVTSNHAGNNPAVANMSLGGSVSTSLDTAVNNFIADGVSYAIAAGNSSANV